MTGLCRALAAEFKRVAPLNLWLLSDYVAHFPDQFLWMNRFRHDLECCNAILHQVLENCCGSSGSAHEQDVATAFVADLDRMLKPLDARHHDVEQYQVWRDSTNNRQRLFHGCGCDGGEFTNT